MRTMILIIITALISVILFSGCLTEEQREQKKRDKKELKDKKKDAEKAQAEAEKAKADKKKIKEKKEASDLKVSLAENNKKLATLYTKEDIKRLMLNRKIEGDNVTRSWLYKLMGAGVGLILLGGIAAVFLPTGMKEKGGYTAGLGFFMLALGATANWYLPQIRIIIAIAGLLTLGLIMFLVYQKLRHRETSRILVQTNEEAKEDLAKYPTALIAFTDKLAKGNKEINNEITNVKHITKKQKEKDKKKLEKVEAKLA